MNILGLTIQKTFSLPNMPSMPQALTAGPLRSDYERTPNKDTVSFGKRIPHIFIDKLDSNAIGYYVSKLKRLPSIPCAYCGQIMLSPKMHNKIANDLSQSRGKKLADAIRVNMNFFKGEMKDIAIDFAEFVESHPKNDIPTLLRLYRSEIHYRHAQKLFAGEGSYPDKFSFKELFVIKNANNSPREFFGKMLRGAMATTEHIRPRVRGGKSDLKNMCVVCSSCNASRAHKRLNEFAEEVPSLAENIKKQLDYLLNISGMDSQKYTSGVAETFMYESMGKIDLGSYIQK